MKIARHLSTGNLYEVLAITDRIKLFGIWWTKKLVIYRRQDGYEIYVRTLPGFLSKFDMDYLPVAEAPEPDQPSAFVESGERAPTGNTPSTKETK